MRLFLRFLLAGQKILYFSILLSELQNAIYATPISVFVDDSIQYAEEIFSLANQDAQNLSVQLENILYTTSTCDSLADSTNILKFFENYHKNNYRISIGPTCINHFIQFCNLTYQNPALQLNILTGYPYKQNQIIDIVTRSPANIAENIISVIKKFQWEQIGIIFCTECYQDDVVASENYFQTILQQLSQNDIKVKIRIDLDRGALRNTIASQILPLNKTARAVISFLGNTLSDYSEFLGAMKFNNFSTDEFTTIAVLSKYRTQLSTPWETDATSLTVFEGLLMLYNNYYDSSKLSSFLSKFSFSSQDEMLISLQLYESYHVISSYLSAAMVNSSLLNYQNSQLFVSSLHLAGPFGLISINRNGNRIAPFDLAVVSSNQTADNHIQLLARPQLDTTCDLGACLTFQRSTLVYEALKDTPVCGYSGELCDQTMIVYIILVIMVAITTFILVYCIAKKYTRKSKGRSLASPWYVPFEEINFIHLMVNGSQHLSIQSLQRNMEEKSRNTENEGGPSSRTKLIANYDQTYVLVSKYIMRDRVRPNSQASQYLYMLKSSIQNENMNNFIGLSFDREHLYVLWTQCFRGNLADVIFDADKKVDMKIESLKPAFVKDILKGLEYLTTTSLGFHGALTATNCMVDSHWMIKLSGFGMNRLLYRWKNGGQIFTIDNQPIIPSSELHYYAPEIRKMLKVSQLENDVSGNGITVDIGKPADMFSFGMILYEILFKQKVVDIIDKPLNDCFLIDDEAEEMVPLSPTIPENDMHPDLIQMMQKCWDERPQMRPKPNLARKITDTVLKMSGSLVDNMIKNLEDYTNGLQNMVAERTKALEEEQEKADMLLSELLPKSIAEELKMGRQVHATTYESATILYSDIVGFTRLCSESEPMEVVALLSGMYQRFDLIISQQNGYKMETIGDAYCVAAGLPIANKNEHVRSIAMIALLQREFLHQFEIPHRPGQYLECRWGFNSGPVFSGVIGIRAPRYACFGTTVTIAAKMESTGQGDRIQMSIFSQMLVEAHHPEFQYWTKGSVSIDGIGVILTYWLEGIREDIELSDHSINKTKIHEELEKIRQRESNGVAGGNPPANRNQIARQKAIADKQREMEEKKQKNEHADVVIHVEQGKENDHLVGNCEKKSKPIFMDTPPTSTSSTDESRSVSIRVDSERSTKLIN